MLHYDKASPFAKALVDFRGGLENDIRGVTQRDHWALYSYPAGFQLRTGSVRAAKYPGAVWVTGPTVKILTLLLLFAEGHR